MVVVAAERRAVALLCVAMLVALPTCRSDGPGTRPTIRPRPTATTTPQVSPPPAGVDELPSGDDVTVIRIIDGDTLVVTGDERVRLIGIDAPEMNQDECFAGQSTAHLTALVPPGTRVRLVYDVERYDRYGRTLAYLYRLRDGLHVNLAMARDGFAQQLTIPPNVAHATDVAAAVAEARDAGRGLWGAGCATATPDQPDTARPGSGSTSGPCDPSYPTLCIPPGVADLDCADITERYFPVLPPDPHRFDRNYDGVGCEAP